MTYVHGHARDDGWVVGHVRRPNRPEGEQLPLPGVECEVVGEVAMPAPRASPDAAFARTSAGPPGPAVLTEAAP